MITMKEAIAKVVKGTNLTLEESKDVMNSMLGGDATEAQIASFLSLLRVKGETLDEIVGCATVMQSKALSVEPKSCSNYVDMVGTGGDGTNTFNISTTAAFVAAGAGVTICKHGNRAISSKSGSIDVLEKLGINVMLENKEVEKCVDETGIGFMFAQVFHKSMKTVGKVRKELGIRTIFNILGPLSNPSNAKRTVIGVFSKDLTEPFAQAMKNMGVEKAMIISGADGMDELTTTGDTYVSEIIDGTIKNYTINPKDFGLETAAAEELKGGSGEENAETAIKILKGEIKGAKRDIVCYNAAAALYVSGIANDIKEGIKLANAAIDNGSAYKKLEAVIELTNRL